MATQRKTKTPASHSRITRSGTRAPRATRKKQGLSEETVIELLGEPPAPPPVAASPAPIASRPAPAPAAAPVPPPVARTPIPWIPPPAEEVRTRSPWIGVDGRALVRAAAVRLGRALGRRIPILARVGGLLRRFW